MLLLGPIGFHGRVDFVSEDILCNTSAHGEVKSLEQLHEGLTIVADEHGEAIRSVDRGCVPPTESSVPRVISVVDQFGDMGQKVVRIRFGVEIVEPGCTNESKEDGGAFAFRVVTS